MTAQGIWLLGFFLNMGFFRYIIFNCLLKKVCKHQTKIFVDQLMTNQCNTGLKILRYFKVIHN